MNDRSGVYVAALGAITPLGRDAWSTAAAVRAGVSGFTEHPFMVDMAGEPMRVAMAPWLDAREVGPARFEALLLPALAQVLDAVESASDAGVRVALALGLPLTRPGLPSHLEEFLRTSIAVRFRNRLSAIATFPDGHAAGLTALSHVEQRIRLGDFEACIIAGVESYLAPVTLEWLEANQQLHGAGRLNNAWGFIPGEAAGAALVAGDRAVERLGLNPLARVLSVGTGLEKNRIKTETVCIGEGLTTAFRGALMGLPAGEQVTDVFCDMNGEAYRADEFGFAVLRTKEAFRTASDFVAPADCWGDTSAASVPLGFVLSTVAAKKGYANGSFALLWSSSEDGHRGAALLELPHGEARL